MGRRVLVADDSAVVRLTVARRVRAEGHDVVEADSVRAALAVDVSNIDCALLDLDLGDGFGTDVAEKLSVPFAFFTSEKSGDALERAKALGAVFAKPDQLEDAVAWVNGRRT